LAQSAARCRRLAERIVAAAAERAGFVVVTGAVLRSRRALLQAIAEVADGAFQIVEIAGPGAPKVFDPHGAAAAGRAPGSPLFVIDDAAQLSSAGLRDVCQTAPLSPEWAAMLSVRAVLITRFPIAELQFLAPRIVAAIAFDEDGPDDGAEPSAPPRSRVAPARAADRPKRVRPPAALAGRRSPPARRPEDAAVVPPSATRRAGRDLRPYALLAYLVAIGALGGCYLALQQRQVWLSPPSDVAGIGRTPTAAAAAAGPAAAK
jgi:hypothetical protein